MAVEVNPAIEKPSSHLLPAKLLYEIVELCLIGTGIAAMLLLLPRRFFLDGNVRLRAVINLLQNGTVSHMSYSFVGPTFSTPLWVSDRLTGSRSLWQGRYNIFLLAAVLIIVYIVLRKRMDAGLLRKFFLVIIVGSMFGNHVTYFGGEVFTALLVGMGILVALIGPEIGGWSAVVLGVVNTPASLLGLGLVIFRYITMKRRVKYLLVFVAAALLIMAEAWLRRSGPFDSGYEKLAFSTPFFPGLISILFSFGKGLIFFAPALLLPVKKGILSLHGENQEKLYSVYILWVCFLVGLILIYSSWWAWYGGWFWGPRFFLFASIPASFVLAVRLRNPSSSLLGNLLTLFFLGYSLWVGINGAVYDQSGLAKICVAHNYALEYLCHYHPLYSVLWYPFVDPMRLTLDNKLFILYSLVIFAYLAAPLLLVMAKQTLAKLHELRATLLNLKQWYF
jgi:hypothetical protein